MDHRDLLCGELFFKKGPQAPPGRPGSCRRRRRNRASIRLMESWADEVWRRSRKIIILAAATDGRSSKFRAGSWISRDNMTHAGRNWSRMLAVFKGGHYALR